MANKLKLPLRVHDRKTTLLVARHQGVKLITGAQLHRSSSEPEQNSAESIAGSVGKGRSNTSEAIVHKPVEIPVDDPDVPSVDLHRKPKGIIRWFKYLPGRVRRFYYILRPPLTPDQLEELAIKKLEMSRDKLCRKEGCKYGRLISEKLAQLGLRDFVGNNTVGKPRKVKKVRWSMITRDELFTKIILRMDTNPRHLPDYVRVADLGRKEFYADEMLPTLGHYMEFRSDEAGVFAVVFRQGLDGIPDTVTAAEIWSKIPENKPPLTIPVGYGDNSKRIDLDLDDCPHMIVAGATGQGKSNFINNILCFWLRRGLTPDDLQLVLFDLKRGMEFIFYAGLPHLYQDPEDVVIREKEREKESLEDEEEKNKYKPAFIASGIVEDLKDVMPALLRLRRMMDSRMDKIKSAGYKDFNSYNQSRHTRKNRIPAIVVVFDEWARVRLSLGTEPESLLAEIANLARAAGMYFILGTQNPNSSVISPLISINFSSRIVFKCSIGGSMAALGNQFAKDLERPGRGILQHHGSEWKLQTPEITDGLIHSVVHKAITGEDRSFTSSVDMEDILKYALDNMDGVLEFTKLFEIFREKKITKNWLTNAFREAEKQTFDLGGTLYKVCPRGSHAPRHLERVDP